MGWYIIIIFPDVNKYMIVKRLQKNFSFFGSIFNNGMDYIDWIEIVKNLAETYPYSVDKDFLVRSLVEGDLLRQSTGDNDEWSYDDLTASVFYYYKYLTKKQAKVVKNTFENIIDFVSANTSIGDLKDYSLYVVFLEKKDKDSNNINLVFSFKGIRGKNKGKIADYTVEL